MPAVGALPWRALVDFAVLTTAIYVVLHWSREARALRVTFGILALEAGALAAVRADLVLTSWVLHGAAIVAAIVLIALFQPELRYALNRLEVTAGRFPKGSPLVAGLEAISTAIFSLAAAHRGGLVVLQRRDAINELVQGGVPLGGQLSVEILEAIFRKVSPVHDGATVVEGNQITRVGAILPLSDRPDLPRSWGTRHRAAMGLAERSDAIVIVASEERGDVTVISDGQFRPVSSAQELLAVLHGVTTRSARSSGWHLFDRKELGTLAIAVSFATAIWATLVLGENTVQTRTVPVELINVADGLRISQQSTATVQLRLHGSSWLLTSVDPRSLVLRVSMAEMKEGMHTVALQTNALTLPFGVTVDGVSPERISVGLARQSNPARERER
jgi:diadenylate cyclase